MRGGGEVGLGTRGPSHLFWVPAGYSTTALISSWVSALVHSVSVATEDLLALEDCWNARPRPHNPMAPGGRGTYLSWPAPLPLLSPAAVQPTPAYIVTMVTYTMATHTPHAQYLLCKDGLGLPYGEGGELLTQFLQSGVGDRLPW